MSATEGLVSGEERCAEIHCTSVAGEAVVILLVKGDEKAYALYVFSPATVLQSVVPVLDTTTLKADGTSITVDGLFTAAKTSQLNTVTYTLKSPAGQWADFFSKFQSVSALAKRLHLNSGGSFHNWTRFAAALPRVSSGMALASAAQPNSGEERFEEDAKMITPEAPELESEAFIDGFLQRKSYDYTPASMQSIREAWIHAQLAQRAPEFTKQRAVTVCIGTYNVNGKYPMEEGRATMDLGPWLRFRPEESPDIYVLGFQELDLTAEALIFNDSTREEDWSRAIELSFHEGHHYRKLKSKQLVGMLLMVYVKAELLPHIRDVQTDAQGTGILGMMGNKGGVAIRFALNDSTLCFVNSHLAAHDDEVRRRNQDHHDICRRVLFNRDTPAPFTIFDHDHLFWLGDLNYRIPLPDAEVKTLARKGTFDKLLEYDQLHEQKRLRLAFVDFEEGPITFAPTYKYDPGTNDFDSSEKMRTPAYCDRVLCYRGSIGKPGPVERDTVVLQHYVSAMDCKVSDHKPVRAQYLVQIKVIEADRQREVYNSIVRQLDTIENKSLPDVTISSNQLTFENVRFLRPQKHTITIKNVGQVPARFQFLPKPGQAESHKQWLWIDPSSDMIMPAAQKEVGLTVVVDDRSADALNSGADSIEDILILHLENGKDLFITISGNYLRTSFCTNLEELVVAPGPVRSLPAGPIPRKSAAGPPDGVARLHVPKELWLLVDYMYRNGLQTESLFLTSGNRKNIWTVIEALDTGKPIPDGIDVHSVAETLVRFLDGLPEPVIPSHLYRRCIDSVNSVVLCRQVVSEMPPVPQCVFIYIMAFLREVLRNTKPPAPGDDTVITADKLALIFGSLLLRPPTKDARQRGRTHSVLTGDTAEALLNKKQAAFVRHFLVSAGDA